MYDADYEEWVRENDRAEEIDQALKAGKVVMSDPNNPKGYVIKDDSEYQKRKARAEEWQEIGTTEPVTEGRVTRGAGKLFITRDSGKKAQYADGMQRDTSEGKPQFSLMFPKGVPYDEQLITRVAMLYMRGGVKYQPRNWEKSSTEESLAHHEDAFLRHVVKFLLGVEDGEDHAAAVVWNVNAIDLTRRNIREAKAREAKMLKVKADQRAATETINHLNKVEAEMLKAEVPGSDKAVLKLEDLRFRAGDTLTDCHGWTWQYMESNTWYCEEQKLVYESIANLAKWHGILRVDSGKYTGLTIEKDGTLRWE